MKRFFVGILGAMVATASLAMPGFNINNGYPAATMTLSATGSTPCIPIISVVNQGSASAPYLQPMVLVNLSAGASLTYSVQVTGDDVLATGWSAVTANWVGFTNMTTLSASSVGTLGAAATCIRLNVSAYTSGSAILEVVQQVRN